MHLNCDHSTEKNIKKMKYALCFVMIYAIIEIYGHYLTNSLSLLAEGIHLLIDIFGIFINLIAFYFAKKQSNENYNFGYFRFEPLFAFFSIMMIWESLIYIGNETWERFHEPQQINTELFLFISIFGIFFNSILLYTLHGNHNLNIRATYVHVIGDFFQSISIFCASIIAYFYPQYIFVDLICTVIFMITILCSTIYILRDIIFIFLEKTPSDINYKEIYNSLKNLQNIKKIHYLKIWMISSTFYSAIIKLELENFTVENFKREKETVENIFKIYKKLKLINIEIIPCTV